MTTKTHDSKTKIEQVSIDKLIPYARNSRTHSDAQVAQIAASIKEFGFTNPVLIDGDGGIIAGHGRIMAAKSMKLDSVPCIRLDHLSEAQKKAYVIADNKLALNAGWDNELLVLELGELGDLGFDLDLTGFTAAEIDALITDEEGEMETGAQSGNGSLAARFLIPPFTVLNAREGWWQDRKRAWLALGIKSELGRGDEAPGGGGGGGQMNGLTWGNSEAMRAGSLNLYRERNLAAAQDRP